MSDPSRMNDMAERRMRSQGNYASNDMNAFADSDTAMPMTAPPTGQRPDRWMQGGNGSLIDPITGQQQPRAPGIITIPFGGAFAQGGIAPAGRASLVGENGPEMIVPMGPTAVLPIKAAPPNVPTGMLVPSSSGGVKWQPGTGPGTTLPPQSGGASAPPSMMPAAPPLPFAMPAQRAAYVNTGSGLDRAVSTGLAGAPRRQVGRSANDPTRIAEQMRRRGDPRAIMQLGQMQMGQDFARERDAVNFQQQQAMFNQQQQAMDARDARNFDQGVMMFGMQQGAADARDVRNFQQQRQIEAERFMAEQAAQEAARNRVPMMGQVPIPGTNYVGTYADGRYMGNVPMAKPPEPLSFQPVPGTNVMVPRGEGADRIPLMENRGTIESPRLNPNAMGTMPGMMDLRPLDQTPRAPRAPQVRRILNAAGQEVDMQWNAQTNQWEPVAMAGGSATSAPASGNVPPSPTTGKTASGISFTLK